MRATELRKIAEGISTDRAQAEADVKGWEQKLARMEAEGTHGARDVAEMRQRVALADHMLNDLAEQEHHAWDAYNDASQQEHYEYLAEQDAL